MIARKPHPHHPEDSSQYVCVPLMYDRQRGHWAPLTDDHHVDEMDAARACVEDWRSQWQHIQKLARQVRAFCDHPSFVDFEGDGIDAAMIVDSAHKLADAIEIGNDNIERLLDLPGEDDTVHIGGLLYQVNLETSLLELVREASESHPSPDRVFLQLIHRALDQVRSLTNQSVGRRGFEDAIDALILMQPEDDDDEHDPAQFIADQRFLRGMSAALRRARERTGQPVSERGLREMIVLLERVIEDRSGSADGVVAEFIQFPEGTPQHKLPTDGGNGEGRDDLGDDDPTREDNGEDDGNGDGGDS